MKKNTNLRSVIRQSHHFKLIIPVFLINAFALALPANATPNLFRSSERISSSLEDFPKWNKVMERTKIEGVDSPVEESNDINCTDNSKACELEKFLTSIKSLDPKEQIEKVNSYHNKTRYILDIKNWGVSDYWATLMEFLRQNGDCEDYAIAKYISLKKIGFDSDDLRIVILHDQNLKLMHSVLAVYQEDKIYILDNQVKAVLEDTRIHHYVPIYSINEHHWWRHIPNG